MQQYRSTLRLSSAARDAERGVKPQSCLWSPEKVLYFSGAFLDFSFHESNVKDLPFWGLFGFHRGLRWSWGALLGCQGPCTVWLAQGWIQNAGSLRDAIYFLNYHICFQIILEVGLPFLLQKSDSFIKNLSDVLYNEWQEKKHCQSFFPFTPFPQHTQALKTPQFWASSALFPVTSRYVSSVGDKSGKRSVGHSNCSPYATSVLQEIRSWRASSMFILRLHLL